MAGILTFVLFVGQLTVASALAQTDSPDQGPYTLFNPTPSDQMRPMSADRPDGTESPHTVDPGHVQIELSLVSYTRNDDSGTRDTAYTIFDTNIKLGLTHNSDLQIIFPAYTRERSDPRGMPDSTADGFGDVTLRLKINLWGNDEGDTAFAIMPHIKIPTGVTLSNDHVEGGLILALGWDAAENWGVGLMLEFDGTYDDSTGDYNTEMVHTAVLGFDLVEPLGAYLEYIGVLTTESAADYQAIFSTGLTFAVSPNTVLDIGAQIGLTDTADDVTVFTGITKRF